MTPYSDKAWHTIGSSYWKLLGSFEVREGRRATVGASGSLSSFVALKAFALWSLQVHFLWSFQITGSMPGTILGLGSQEGETGVACDRSGGKMKINKKSILSLGPGCYTVFSVGQNPGTPAGRGTKLGVS